MALDLDRARDALPHIDPGCPRDEWIKTGMAAKSAGLTFDEFHTWSKPAHNYRDEADCRSVWKSFNGSGVTAATLFRMAQDAGWQDTEGNNGARHSLPTHKPARAAHKPAMQAASGNVADVWAACVPADAADAYIHRKQGTPDGLRIYPASAPPLVIRGQNVAGYLMVPCYAPDEKTLLTIQFIPPGGGDKLNLPGAQFGAGFFTVGDLAQSARVFIVEGIGQAWAAWKATGCAAVVSFGSGRMATVAKAVRAKHPAARLVVLPDRGKESQAAAIAADVAGEWCELPGDKPGNFDANDYLLEAGADALADLLEHTKAPPIPLGVIFADELPETFTPPDEVVEGVLTAGDGSVLYGDSNSGKTFMVIDVACAVARGVPWLGKQTEQGLVVYLAVESPASVRLRLQAYQKHHGVKVPNCAIVQNPIDLFDGDADTDKLIEVVHQIEKQRGQTARLIVGDTLARLSAGANENAGQDMSLVVRRFDRIRTECKAHFLLIHHCGKNAAAGSRGWSGVRAAIDTEIEVTDSPAGRCAEITKQRDLSTKGDRIGFRLDVVTLGLTKWGKPATSCVVVSADAPAKPTGKRMGEVEGAVVEFLAEQKVGIKKRDVVAHFDGRYEKGPIYRSMKTLVTAGIVHEAAGIVALTGAAR